MRQLIAAGLFALAATPAFAGPIGFSYSAQSVYGTDRPFNLDERLNAAGRVTTPDGLKFIEATIGYPDRPSVAAPAATGTIPLLSLPTDAFVIDGPGSYGSGIFNTYVSVFDWAGRRSDQVQGFSFGAYGEVLFADNDPARGRLELRFPGTGGGKRFDSLFNHYEFQLIAATEGGVTRIDAEYTVTPLDGSEADPHGPGAGHAFERGPGTRGPAGRAAAAALAAIEPPLQFQACPQRQADAGERQPRHPAQRPRGQERPEALVGDRVVGQVE